MIKSPASDTLIVLFILVNYKAGYKIKITIYLFAEKGYDVCGKKVVSICLKKYILCYLVQQR